MSEHDVVVIGAGNAGIAAASGAREGGKRVAIVESFQVGGVCPLRGCVPKKVLVAVAETLDVIARAGDLGITVGAPTVDWPAVIDRKRAILAGTSEGLEGTLAGRGIELVRGRARFVAEDAVEVDGRRMRADAFVIATGSMPRPLAIEGAALLTTSDELLELRTPPASLVFVGAGVIAFELGHVYARLGTKVTLLEVTPRPLGMLDEDAVGELVAATRAIGIELRSGVTITRIARTGSGDGAADAGAFEVTVTGADGHAETIRAACVAHGAGRVADVADLGLDAANVALERGAVKVGAPYRSASNPRVYVAGDALVGTPQLSPVATYEGRLVGRALRGEDVAGEYGAIPSCVYAVPTLATVGRSERRAREDGIAVTVKRNSMTGWRSGRTYAERHAWAKVLIGDDDRIVGAHLLGHGAGETIHAFAFAMQRGITARELREGVYAYPTFTNDLRYLL